MAETISSTRYTPQDKPHPHVREGDTVVRVPGKLLRHLLRGFGAWRGEVTGQRATDPGGWPEYQTALRLNDVVIIADVAGAMAEDEARVEALRRAITKDAVEGGDGGGEE